MLPNNPKAVFLVAATSILLLSRTRAISDQCSEQDNPSLLQGRAQHKLNTSKASSAPSYWLQIATQNKEGCWTNNDVWAEARGNGKSTGWTQNLASQIGGANFRQGDRVVYTLDCLNSDCPTPEEVTEICFKLQVRLFSDGTWCPTDVMLFTKPDFKRLGQQMSWPEKWTKDADVCKEMEKSPLGLPKPSGDLVQETMYWADFGLAEEQKASIVPDFPIPQGIKNPGAYSLYQGFGEYVRNQGGKPSALFLLGDNGYLGGRNLGKVMDGIQFHGNNVISSNMVFPAIGNHDVNAASGCSSSDLGTCYYGDQVSVISQSKEIPGFNFEAWKQNWISAFPGLSQGKVLIPPGNHKWLAPLRYNVDLGNESSVYYIVGLVAGTYRNEWAPGQPPEAFPASIQNWQDQGNIECDFVKDSVAHGERLGKTIFIYLTHEGPRKVGTVDFCDDAYKKLDIWLFGHIHAMDLSAPKGQVVEQQKDSASWYPVRMLLGNGGFDEASMGSSNGLAANHVSFVTMKEYKMPDGSRELHIQAYDTCISATNCRCKSSCGHSIPPWTCWDKCLSIEGGINGIKATKSKDDYKFIYRAKK